MISSLMIDGMASNGGSRLGSGYERVLAVLFFLSVIASALLALFKLNFRTNTKMQTFIWLVLPLGVCVGGLILLSMLGLNIG